MQRSLLKGLHEFLQKQNHPFKLLSYKISTNIFARFNEVPQNIESWSTVVSILAQGGSNRELALHNASKMINSGDIKPDGYSLVHLVRASTDLGLYSFCQQLHCYVLKSGFGANVSVSSSLVRFYKVKESTNDVHKMFVEIPQPNAVCWNTLISAFLQSGHCVKVLGLFLQLDRSDTYPDAFSFTMALSVCGQLSLLQLGRSIHCKIMKLGPECSVFVGNCLIDMYGKCASVKEAVCVFDVLIDKDIISWNSVIAASARNGRLELAVRFFHQMPEHDTISYNEMINGIAQFGNIEDAIDVLSDMPNPNSSSWNSIITAYVNRSQAREALTFFAKMHSDDIKKDDYTYSVLLSGVGGLAALKWGILIHCCTIKSGMDTSVLVGTALIDMYSKCGQVRNAESMFQSLPTKNLVTWNVMISGYARNGDSDKVIQQFEKMKMIKNLKPDPITFVNVMAACSNTEVPLQKAIQYFELMVNDYMIEPTVEHCCSMIRLMGQRGEACQAARMIYELAFASCGVVWRALLGACGACRNLKLAQIAAAKVIELEGDGDYVYITMSNLFASYGRWSDVSKIRKIMSDREVRKEVGCSWIEVEKATS